jgi:hypothetical protein
LPPLPASIPIEKTPPNDGVFSRPNPLPWIGFHPDPQRPHLSSSNVSTFILARSVNSGKRTLLATDNFSAGAYAQPKAVALAMHEIAPDPDGWIRAVRHDVDRADALEHVAALVEDGTLPEPSWIIVRPANGHAHVVWELGRWVRRDRLRQLGLFERVREALRERVGGDPAYVGRFQHNPLHPDFERWGAGRTWELGELVAAIGEDVWTARRRLHAKIDPITASLGRNCSHFENVRVRAYAIVGAQRRAADYAGFKARITAVIADANAALSVPLPEKEIRRIASSIVGWTWNVYRRGKGAAQARKDASEQARAEYLAGAVAARAEARALHSDGLGASEIARRMKRSRSWVYVALAEACYPGALAVAAPAAAVMVAKRIRAAAQPGTPGKPTVQSTPAIRAYAHARVGRPSGTTYFLTREFAAQPREPGAPGGAVGRLWTRGPPLQSARIASGLYGNASAVQ